MNPHAWIIALPVALALVAIHRQPAGHPLKRLWRDLCRCEAHTWSQAFGVKPPDNPERLRPWQHRLLGALVATLALGSLLSLATFLGFLEI